VTAQYPAMSLADIDLSDTEFWARPLVERQAAFATLRAAGHPPFFAEPETPFAERGPGYYALVRHADVVAASRNPEVFSSGRGATSIPDLPAEFNEYFGSMINMDDPRHARLRRIVSRAFTPRMIQKFEGDVQRVAAAIVDDLLATGPCDFVEHVAARLPLTIICQLMGIPDSSYGLVLHDTNTILSGMDPDLISQDLDEAVGQILAAGAELADLVTGLAAERAGRPGDDLVSALVTANIDGEHLTSAELASFFILLVVAGNETTRQAISHSMKALIDNPDQMQWLVEHPEKTQVAVEEFLRFASPVYHFRRTATRDVELHGKQIRSGDKVVMWWASGNRDETKFEDPYALRLDRMPNDHMSFGKGPHTCMGSNLARFEMRILFETLLPQVAEITQTGDIVRVRSNFVNGIKRFPVRIVTK
jgi:methyl-branched lipid omega-hydroxylase